MKIIFNKYSGQIYRAISKDQEISNVYFFYDEEFKEKLDEVVVDNVPMNLGDYYVKDGILSKYTERELEEKQIYGKVLTDEERLLNKLKPTIEEIQKAEQTIEILTLIQEVM